MAKSAIRGYNAVIAAIKKSTGVSHKEAQQAYRGAKVRMGRAPTAADVAKSRAVREEAKTAGAKIAAKRRAEDAERARRIARTKEPPRRRGKKEVAIPPPKPKKRRGGAEIDGGGGGGGGGGFALRPPTEDEVPDWVEFDEPFVDEFEGEEGDYPRG